MYSKEEILLTLAPNFISFEGPDGSGKSSQIKILTDQLTSAGKTVVYARVPGGTPVGSQIRNILLHNKGEDPCDRAEIMLFAAAHAQIADKVIRPALKEGKIVIADRYTDSMICYQGIARGFGEEAIREIARLATDDLWPCRTVLLDINPKIGFKRMMRSKDRIEQAGIDFHNKVRRGFLRMANAHPERWVVTDGSHDVETVADAVWNLICDQF